MGEAGVITGDLTVAITMVVLGLIAVVAVIVDATLSGLLIATALLALVA
ncbi:hypothetical protein [Sphaerisporangium corydalis]|uniref:Uncharacterized protein n=1 Tax=Sphaerisporangium corydalis TaxID=1441875 RepID=A0ABV9EPF0_9ACTN|nr:hypothetical protein [Sphaerisporangium corydalis]